MNKFRPLREDEIEIRVGSVSAKGCTLLLYKDARVDQNILDETVGPENWQRDHKEVKDNMYCGVGVRSANNDWVWKWDAGTESNTEAIKGEASDSFKRACVNWGIGRELYSAPMVFHFCETEPMGSGYKLQNRSETFGMKVSKIGYKNGAIATLEITDKKGNVVYSMGGYEDEKDDLVDDLTARTIIKLADEKGSKVSDICKHYKVDSIYSLTKPQGAEVKVMLSKKK